MRRLPLAAVAMLLAVAGACGDDSTPAVRAGTTTTPTTPVATAAATAAITTAAITTAAITTTSTAAPTTARPTTAAPTTSAPTTKPSVTPFPTAPTTAKPTANYSKVSPPNMPEATAPIPATGLPDGVYYAVLRAPLPPTGVSVQILQWLSGTACEAEVATSGGECANDYMTKDKPQRVLPIELSGALVTVAEVSDPATSYAVTPAEFVRLYKAYVDTKVAKGGAGAPPGYSFTPFAVRLEIKGIKVVAVEQVWTP